MAAKLFPHIVVGVDGAHGADIHPPGVVTVGVDR